MEILSWMVVGLIVAGLAITVPGDEPRGIIVTTMIGIVCAVTGAFIVAQLGYADMTGFGLRSFVITISAGLVLLGGYWLLRRSFR